MTRNNNENVLLIYCKCGKNLIEVGDPTFFSGKELGEAVRENRKIETISIEEFRTRNTKFYCPNYVEENVCPNNITPNK